jgi:hypothetical protein
VLSGYKKIINYKQMKRQISKDKFNLDSLNPDCFNQKLQLRALSLIILYDGGEKKRKREKREKKGEKRVKKEREKERKREKERERKEREKRKEEEKREKRKKRERKE